MRPTRLPSVRTPSMPPDSSTNHKAPSGPIVMSPGPLFGRGRGNSVITPLDVMRPILSVLYSENQILPSPPAASARGPLFGVGGVNSLITPLGVMLPTLPAANMPNQILPSSPRAMARG